MDFSAVNLPHAGSNQMQVVILEAGNGRLGMFMSDVGLFETSELNLVWYGTNEGATGFVFASIPFVLGSKQIGPISVAKYYSYLIRVGPKPTRATD
jgi:hypothetical protein